MRIRRFEWEGPANTAVAIREWADGSSPDIDVEPIGREVRRQGDAAVLRLTARFDATEQRPSSLTVPAGRMQEALERLDPGLREALELAAANIRAVAEAQLDLGPRRVELPQGQSVELRRSPVDAAGLYAPGGSAAYPSSVLMCAIPARVAGVRRLALASPPGPDADVHPLVLAAAALCDVDEVFAMGGAQAIFALAHGTETVDAVDVVAGPGNAWVREAKRAVYGEVGIDSLAGPSELMAIVERGVNLSWLALDLCAQAEHGGDGALIVVALEDGLLEPISDAVEAAAAELEGVGDAPLALVQAPAPGEAVALANAFAPEHLELLGDSAAALADDVTSAGCVFRGERSATAFGDYAAGSNHVLPTGGAGRFSGPLGPDAFMRTIAVVEVSEAAASKLAPHVDVLARAEGFPVHGRSAMIRAKR